MPFGKNPKGNTMVRGQICSPMQHSQTPTQLPLKKIRGFYYPKNYFSLRSQLTKSIFYDIFFFESCVLVNGNSPRRPYFKQTKSQVEDSGL